MPAPAHSLTQPRSQPLRVTGEKKEFFTYLIAARLEDGEHEGDREAGASAMSRSRIVRTPLKRKGHVTIDACGEDGQLERFVVTRRREKAKLRGRLQALGVESVEDSDEVENIYKSARKSAWGGVWLGE